MNEDGIPITAVTVNRINGNLGSVSVTINLSNSTATPGSDYNNSPITLNFADRETSKIVTVPIIDDSIYEPTENINLTLINPTGGATLGTQKTAILRILDNDPTNNIVLLKDDFNTENGGIGKLNYTSLANWNVARGSIDLIGNSFHVNVPEQGLFLDLDGSTLNAGRIESKQTFNFNANQVVTLNFTVSGNFVPGNSANNSFTASLGDLFNETFTVPANQPFTTFTRSFVVPLTETGKLIIDHAGGDNYGAFIDDIELSVSAMLGTIQFNNSTYSINENGTPVTAVTLTRSNGSDGAVSVRINLTNGTATAPSDYNNTQVTVNFANGETSKTVNIPIVNDTQFEPDETVNLSLSNPTGGATLGTQTTAVLTIINDDLPQRGIINPLTI